MHRSREDIAGGSGIRRPGETGGTGVFRVAWIPKRSIYLDQPILCRRCRMSTLDEITKEKQRISEALARVDMQREKLASQLGELEATERVLARYGKGTQLRQTASARTPATATKTAAPARRRGRPPTTTAKAAGGKRSSSNLGDQVLALATGKTQREIASACKGARPNHVGAALSRHKRAGRIEKRDGKLYAVQSTSTEQQAAR